MAARSIQPIIPYVRVSRLGGRSGESFISMKDQRRELERYAAHHKVILTEFYEDADVSGKSTDRPAFQAALTEIQAGRAGGIMVVKLDRFARSVIDALHTAREIKEWGGRFISTSEAIDIGTPSGELQFTVFAALAQFELARITESWRATTEDLVMRRGVHVSRHVPFGYLRKEDEPLKGKLLPHPEDAPIVTELFERRVGNNSWTKLAEWLNDLEAGGRSWSRTTVQGVIANRVYLGEAHSAGTDEKIPVDRRLTFVNPNAHDPLVTPDVFEAAQQAKGRSGRNGEVADQALCRGLLRCAGCDHRLIVTGQTLKSGERVPIYYCRRLYADGVCPAPASITARKIDPYVEQHFLELLRNPVEIVRAPRESQLPQLEKQLDYLKKERSNLLKMMTPLMEEFGEDEYQQQVRAKGREIAECEAAMQLEHQSLQLRRGIDTGDLASGWGELTIDEKRGYLALIYDQIVIDPTSGNRRGRWAPPAAERVRQIVLTNL